MKRRDFLQKGLKIGVAANALPLMMGGFPIKVLGRSPLRSALEQAGSSNNNALVIIQLQGGNDGLNCIVPYGDPNYKSLRPTLGLDLTKDNLLKLQDHDTLAFHGGMTGFSTLYGASKLALLQSVGYPLPSLSHFRGTDVWNTGTDSNIYSQTGWVGRMLYELNPTYPPIQILPNSDPLAIQFGSSLSNLFLSRNGGMGIAVSQLPTKVNNSVHNYDDLPNNPTVPYQELGYIRTIQRETEVYTTTLASRTVQTNKVTYPTNNRLGDQLASIAQLIASGFTTKVYLVTLGSFDTHSNELTDQAKLLTELSDAVLAFQQDLEAFNVADNVAIMTYSEFGRRPKENGSGTDHGTAAPHFLIGTQVKGTTYGHDPALDAASLQNMSGNLTFDPLHDFRNVYATVMNEWLMAGSDDATRNKTIQDVLTASNGASYSTNSNWTSLGLFKGQVQNYVQSRADATGFMLMQNYPNPVMGRTSIEYALPASTNVELGIFTTAGQEVLRIVDDRESAGPHRASFDASKLASGAYVYRLKTSEAQLSRQLIVSH